jgi:hypothetical protein
MDQPRDVLKGMSMRGWVALFFVLVAAPRATRAQWDLGLELATTRYHGSSRDTTNGSGPPTFRPSNATTIGLRLSRRVGSVRLGLKGSYGKPGLTAAGSGLTVTDNTAGTLYEVSGLMSFQVVGIGPSGAAHVGLGPALHLWTSGEEVRRRIGGRGVISYEWSVAHRWTGAISIEATLSKSWFDGGDLPPEYERQVTWRHGVGLGLSYRL